MSAAGQLELALAESELWAGGYEGKCVNRSSTHLPAYPPTHVVPTHLPTYTPTHLPTRLHALGLPATVRVYTHANRRILVSLTARGGLRVHLGYAMAPDEVLAAIVCWARPFARRAERRAAQRLLTAFPVHEHVPPVREPSRRPEPARPGDERLLERLGALHRELNALHFNGELGPVTLSLSSRMRRRLGEFRPGGGSEPRAEMSISRRHLRRDGWKGVRETLAHELVHQWQAETGRRLGHDAEFRRKCAQIGVDSRATRQLENDLR